MLEMTPAVVAAFNSGDPHAYTEAAHQQIGTASLSHHVCALVLEGKTTVAEAMRLLGRNTNPD